MRAPLFLLIGLITLAGCARQPVKAEVKTGVNFYVGKECHASAVMMGCDPESKSPPSGCKTIKLDYDKSCERLVIPRMNELGETSLRQASLRPRP